MSSKFLDKTGLDTLWAKIKSTFQTLGNLVTSSSSWSSTPSDTKYPSEKLVKDSLDGKQDDLGISASGDAGKFLNEQGDWAVPAGMSSNVRSYYSKYSYLGVKFATTTVTGPEVTSYGVFQFTRLQIGTEIKTLSGNAQKPIVGIVQIFHRSDKSSQTLESKVKARITVLQSDYTGELRVYFKINGQSVDWYIATTTAKDFVAWRTLKLFGYGSVNDIELAGVNDVSDLTENNATYKTPLVAASSTGTGDSSTPVYVDSNGMLVSCNEMLLKSGINATSDCADALLSALPDNWTKTPTDTTKLIRRDTNGSASFGQVTFLTVWNYILSKFPSLGWTGSSAKTLSKDEYNYLIGASITFSVNVTSMRKSTPYRVYVNWHGNILTIKNTSGSTISMAVGTVGTVSVANNNTYALPDLAPTTWTFIYDGSTLYAVPSSSVKYSLTESSSILAARATGDGSGNTISSTYAKKAVERVSNDSYGSNIGYIAPTALCVIGDSHTASSYSVEDIISKTLSASYRNDNGRVYVILNTKSSNVTLNGFVSGTWSLVAGRHTTVVRWNGAYYRQD